jgi:hypothetical protein
VSTQQIYDYQETIEDQCEEDNKIIDEDFIHEAEPTWHLTRIEDENVRV